MGSMTNNSMFHRIKEAADLRIKGLRTRLQVLLHGKGEMTIDNDLVDHCFRTAVCYVKEREAENIYVLKLLQVMSMQFDNEEGFRRASAVHQYWKNWA